MSESLDKMYVYIRTNFIRFGIVLLIVGAIMMLLGIIFSASSNISNLLYLTLTLCGGFVFLSGSLFLIASIQTRS